MTESAPDVLDFSAISRRVSPQKLTVLLERAGWEITGGRDGAYIRLRGPFDDRRSSLLIPLDPAAPDFFMLMSAALSSIQESPSGSNFVRTIAPRLVTEAADQFRFRKESAAPSGLISWKAGEDLIHSARLALIAGAKAHLGRMKHFSNKFGQFANRYLDTVLMGQTAPGSYVVTAFAPADILIPLTASKVEGIPGEGLDSASARTISLNVIEAIQATAEALDHYRSTGSLSGFDDGVSAGISYEMTNAMRSVVADSDGADVSFEFDPMESPADLPATTRIEFRGSDAQVLETVAARLVTPEQEPRVTVTGRVHLLTRKEAGGPGVIGVDTIGSSLANKVRARLESSEDYHLAVRAHDTEQLVVLEGDLSREGNLNWLYRARLLRLVEPEGAERAPREEPLF